jgi:hypothetical protein
MEGECVARMMGDRQHNAKQHAAACQLPASCLCTPFKYVLIMVDAVHVPYE